MPDDDKPYAFRAWEEVKKSNEDDDDNPTVLEMLKRSAAGMPMTKRFDFPIGLRYPEPRELPKLVPRKPPPDYTRHFEESNGQLRMMADALARSERERSARDKKVKRWKIIGAITSPVLLIGSAFIGAYAHEIVHWFSHLL